MNWFARELESLSGNGLDISYSYDENGMRLMKTVNGELTEYQYEGSKLIYEKRGEKEFYYTYDGLGNLSSITYYNNNAKQEYFVLCNSRGDVTELYTENGDLAAHYIYDSWGNTISVTDKNVNEITDENSIGLLNPIRYRGYYLDFETGYYYLQSRYYNPTVGRFRNADSVLITSGIQKLNQYSYCLNNPIMFSDPSGHASESNNAAMAVVQGLFGGIVLKEIYDAFYKRGIDLCNMLLSNFYDVFKELMLTMVATMCSTYTYTNGLFSSVSVSGFMLTKSFDKLFVKKATNDVFDSLSKGKAFLKFIQLLTAGVSISERLDGAGNGIFSEKVDVVLSFIAFSCDAISVFIPNFWLSSALSIGGDVVPRIIAMRIGGFVLC